MCVCVWGGGMSMKIMKVEKKGRRDEGRRVEGWGTAE